MAGLKIALNLLIAIFLLAVISVVATGGYALSLGPVSLSLHSTGTPGLLLGLLALARLAAGGILTFPRVSRGSFRPVRALALFVLVSLLFTAYSLLLRVPLFWGGYFPIFLLGWLAAIVLRLRGRTPAVRLAPPRRLLLMALGAAVFFLVAYGEEPDAPHSQSDCGIWTRYDQSCYLRMASSFADLKISRETYTYGPCYPLLGTPFVRLIPVNPFFLPNLALYVLAVCSFYLAGTRLLGSGGALLAVALSLGPAFVEFFCIPWNSAISVAAAGILLHLSLGARCPSLRAGLAAGLALAASFAARYIDAVILLPLALAALRDRGSRARLTAAAAAVLLIALVLASHWLVLGSPWITPYYSRGETGIGDQTLSAYSPAAVPGHLFEVFCDPFSRTGLVPGPERTPIISRAFILICFPLGLAALLYDFRGRIGPAWGAFIISLVLGWSFYGSFFAGGAFDIIYGNLRYYLPWLPGAAILSVYGLNRAAGWRRKG